MKQTKDKTDSNDQRIKSLQIFCFIWTFRKENF